MPPAGRGVACAGCGAPLAGRYCSACGQDSLPAETAWRSWVEQLQRVLRTLRALVIEPGRLAEEHLRGARGRFVPPFTLFVNAVAIFFLFSLATGFSLKALAQQGPPASGFAAAVEQRAAAAGVPPATFLERAERRFQAVYTAALLLVSVAGYTLLYRVVHWRALPGLRDAFTLALNYLAFIFIVSLPLLALVTALGTQLGGASQWIAGIGGGVVATLWNALAGRRLAHDGWPLAVGKALAVVGLGTVIDNLMFIAAVAVTLRIA